MGLETESLVIGLNPINQAYVLKSQYHCAKQSWRGLPWMGMHVNKLGKVTPPWDMFRTRPPQTSPSGSLLLAGLYSFKTKL